MPGHETWSGDSWKTGGAGVWQIGSYDAELNLTFWGVGNPVPNDNGSSRLGDNLYSNSLIALDADTGALRWHYQFTPHDEMDWDAAQVPVLSEIDWRGRRRRVILFANKNGLMYIIDRSTGEFLLGKPFVRINWFAGFDTRGRPTLSQTPRSEWIPTSHGRDELASGILQSRDWHVLRRGAGTTRPGTWKRVRRDPRHRSNQR